MKEATGELSMTAIVVVIIGVIAVAAPPIVRGVINSAGRSAKCQAAFNCDPEAGDNGMYKCYYLDDGADEATEIMCAPEDIGKADSSE